MAHMKSLVEEYLNYKKKCGFTLKKEGELLLDFGNFADEMGHCGSVTTELALLWSKLPQNADPIYWAKRLDIVRRFAKYRSLFDPDTEIPPPKLLGRSYRRAIPHIYSQEEINALLHTASKLNGQNGLRPKTYYTLFALLVCTGLRISEALNMTQDDVDLQNGILKIKETKFHKTRFVPIHPTTSVALHNYTVFRNVICPNPQKKMFFLTGNGIPLTYPNTLMTFLSLRKKIGLKGNHKQPPRIHDLSYPNFYKIQTFFQDT